MNINDLTHEVKVVVSTCNPTLGYLEIGSNRQSCEVYDRLEFRCYRARKFCFFFSFKKAFRELSVKTLCFVLSARIRCMARRHFLFYWLNVNNCLRQMGFEPRIIFLNYLLSALSYINIYLWYLYQMNFIYIFGIERKIYSYLSFYTKNCLIESNG